MSQELTADMLVEKSGLPRERAERIVAHLNGERPMLSPDLIAFLKAWHDWATSGAPRGEPFSREQGLCGNAMRFAESEAAKDKLWDEMSDAFGEDADLDVVYPFGWDDFNSRRIGSTQHECPKRLAWVRERLVEAGELAS